MPSVYGRTRAQLRQSIGFNLGAIKTGTATGGTNNTLIDVRIKHSKPAPTPDQRKEIGKILDQIRTNQIKRKGSSYNKIYYDGLK